ncbi:MAG: YqaJ viral recombinase family protein [Acidobacteria bacterium Pan2503]|uniref:YqaJ viral recombinase family protein n=1 Tax=Candidatus Acidiferrum panamense TaxID=2741543 RepID=A0A7V8NMV8_9BACT|nr:YqaJ viral recombinase family protein [Candidatus Acidoferrum panamensis]
MNAPIKVEDLLRQAREAVMQSSARRSFIRQDDPLWHRVRIGCLTASRMRHARAMLKRGGESAERYNYKLELVTERLTGKEVVHFVSKAMQDGIEREQPAGELYEMLTGTLIEPGGFIYHPTIHWFGASPDRLIGKDGLVEIKCPTETTFTEWLLAGTIPEEHIDQMTTQLICTERKWCDFVAYHPDFPADKNLIVHRFVPTAEQIAAVEADAQKFLDEVYVLYRRAA